MRAADVRVLFVGCGDLGTGAAHRLVRAGLRVAIVELPRPLAVRRGVAFAAAARAGEIVVEGVLCRRVELPDLAAGLWPAAALPLVVATIPAAIATIAPHALVDARVAKVPLGIVLPAGTLHVALGPGHTAGRDCDAVVETLRGPDLGSVVWQGAAHTDTGTPGELGGATFERVLRAPQAGIWSTGRALGDRVVAGEIVGSVDGEPVRSLLAGRVRGLLADGDPVGAGQKLGDVDPRPDAPDPDRISDKSRRIGEGVLTALRTGLQIEFPSGV